MNVGTYRGVRIKISWAFLVVTGLFVLLERLPEMLMLFGIVVVHEMAHVAVALRFGQRVEEIELLPFGGVARVESPLELNPAVERTVAIAGPLTNFMLFGVGYVVFTYLDWNLVWIRFFMQANAALGLFNLLPALPLDGGRILRASLAERLGFGRATECAVKLGKGLSLVLMIIGSFGLATGLFNVSLMVMSIFIFAAAKKEQANAFFVLFRYITRKKDEVQAQTTLQVEQLAVTKKARIRDVFQRIVPGRYHLIWVIDESGETIGVVTEGDFIDGLLLRGMDTTLQELVCNEAE